MFEFNGDEIHFFELMHEMSSYLFGKSIEDEFDGSRYRPDVDVTKIFLESRVAVVTELY